MDVEETEVLVVGAGLAGLRCAGVLAAAGREVRIWEGDDDIGGRIRTDVVDGFYCDRGFQVLNPASPELEHCVDLDALKLQPFGAGVCVRRERGATTLVHPLRQPARVPSMVAGGAITPAGLVALARWARPALRPSRLTGERGSIANGDMTLAAALDRSGVRG